MPSATPAPSSKRNLQLDIVRGLAILLVLGVHFDLEYPQDGWALVVAYLWRAKGAFGVPLFFVLSGFLIGGLLISELRKRGSIAIPRFLIRRGLKIYPPYYLFMAYLILMPIVRAIHLHQHPGQTAWNVFKDYVPSLLFIQNYVGETMAGHTWSLAVEEHFYLLLPVGIAALVAWRRTSWLLPLCLLAPFYFIAVRWGLALAGDPYVTNTARTLAATHLTIDSLLLGVGLRALEAYRPDLFARFRPWRFILIAAGVGFYFSWPGFTIAGVPNMRILPVNGLCAAAILMGVYATHASDFGFLARPVQAVGEVLGWIGARSYPIYLWHVTLIRIADREIVERLPWGVQTPWGWSCAALIFCIVSVAGGAAVSVLVEKPVLYLRDKYFPSRSA